MTAFDELGTEARDAAGADLDLRTTLELVELMNAEDATVAPAVAGAAASIAALVDDVAARLDAGGRLVYVGAGTSGPPRRARRRRVRADVLGSRGDRARRAETTRRRGRRGRRRRRRSRRSASAAADAVVGISASGRSPWVVGALEAARARGALTGCIVCVEGSELAAVADREVCVPVGAEVIAGSTRLKAGTAQKLVLNMVSTISMIRLGRTHGNLMAGVAPLNDKLRARQRSVVAQAAGVSTEQAAEALADAAGDAKAAITRAPRPALAGPDRRGSASARRSSAGASCPGDVEVVDGRVAGYGLPSPNGRGIASPGFVDLQVNGFGGVDFLDTDAAGYEQAGEPCSRPASPRTCRR